MFAFLSSPLLPLYHICLFVKCLLETSNSSSDNRTLSIPVNNKISSDGRFYVAGVYVDDDENFCAVIESKDSHSALVKAKHIPDLEKGIVSTFEKMMKM